jgi:hypothetical protein
MSHFYTEYEVVPTIEVTICIAVDYAAKLRYRLRAV